jgi:hypothetical protein
VKRLTTATVLVTAGVVLGWNAVEFAGGYNAFPLAIGFFPASFFLFALTSLATCAAVVVVLVALFRRHVRYATILVVAVVSCWLLSPWFVGRSAFLFGFATRLRTLSTPAEIQLASETCLALMPSGGRAVGPKKLLDPPDAEQSKRVWDALSRFRFVHLLDDTCVVFVDPPNVAFSWGGALPGHWGIHVLASSDVTAPSHYVQTLNFSERIILFRGH